MELDKYLKDGYIVSPYYSQQDIEQLQMITTKTFGEKELQIIIRGTIEERASLMYIENELLLLKFDCRYHITPQDLIVKLEKELKQSNLDYDDVVSWSHFSALCDKNGPVFSPSFDEKYYEQDTNGVEDFLFKKPDHIVSFIVHLIRLELNKQTLKKDLQDALTFVQELSNGKACSTSTLSLMLRSILFEEYMGRDIPNECVDFYRKTLLKNVQESDNYSMKALGYDYYEGTHGFPTDPEKSLYWLEKYFKATGDPDVARTIGYIYYYGRTTGGVPQGDKAFQYFAIGHIAGGYYEATYKLADCYLKGYGTPVSYQAAFNLVNSIYKETLDYFTSGQDSKFADVALRMGTFYKDGLYVAKDYSEAQLYYLEAKVAIKTRLEHMDYIGDKSVAIAISKNLEAVEKELGIKERIIKDRGYLIDNPKLYYPKDKYIIEYRDGAIYVTIKKGKGTEKYFVSTVGTIGFVERSEKVVLKVIPKNPADAKEHVEYLNNQKIIEICFKDDKFYTLLDLGKGETFPAYISFSNLIIYPQTIKDISRKYTIISVEYYPGSKLYDYLSTNNNVKIDDTKDIYSYGEKKKVTIKNVKNVYEDQLPLPLAKMAKL